MKRMGTEFDILTISETSVAVNYPTPRYGVCRKAILTTIFDLLQKPADSSPGLALGLPRLILVNNTDEANYVIMSNCQTPSLFFTRVKTVSDSHENLKRTAESVCGEIVAFRGGQNDQNPDK